MDTNTLVLLIIISASCIFWIFLFLTTGIGGFYYLNKDKFNSDTNVKPELKEITCSVKINPDTFGCVSMDDSSKVINIVDGKILKLSYTDEPKSKGSSEIVRYYYIILPYYFAVEYPLQIGTGGIKINTLDDLLKSFDAAHDESYNLIDKSVSDKCLAVKVDKREAKPPYNTACIFMDGGFSTINSISDIFFKAILKSKNIPQTVINDYYNLLKSKIDKDNTLTLFEYVMYIALFKILNENKYNFMSLCDSERNVEC